MPERDEDWPLWFPVVDDNQVGRDDIDWASYFDDADDDFWQDYKMPELHKTFIRELRELIPTWRSLGVEHDDTRAHYADGRVWIGLTVYGRGNAPVLGTLRVDLSEKEWIGSWVTGSSMAPLLESAVPIFQINGQMDDPVQGVLDAVEWFEGQLRRPASRRVWRSNGEVVASALQWDDTGETFIVSGDPSIRQNPESADEVIPIRP